MSQCCAQCKHLVVPNDRAGRRMLRRDSAYRCVAPLPELGLPESVINANPPLAAWPLVSRAYMNGDAGSKCPTFETRDK